MSDFKSEGKIGDNYTCKAREEKPLRNGIYTSLAGSMKILKLVK